MTEAPLQSIVEPRYPQASFEYDWRNAKQILDMVHRRVKCDGMHIRLSPEIYATRHLLISGWCRIIAEIIDSAEIEEPGDAA